MSIGMALAGLAAIAAASRGFRPYGPEDLLRDQFPDSEILEWEDVRWGTVSKGMMPLHDGPYHSSIKDIREACAKKAAGQYRRVWVKDRHGRREICR